MSKLPSTLSFFWGEFWSLGDQKMVLQLLQSICFRKNWPIVNKFWHSSFPWLELHWRQQIFELCKIGEVNPLVLGWQWQRWLGCECHLWWTCDPNIWRKEESKEIRDYAKVEDGCCTKQWVRIPKVTWTSSILRRRFTCQTSFRRASLMKDDVKGEVPNGTSKILIPSNGVVN